ncbi:DUF922 domain-containing protein [uncultured Algibacter sp.]|uniref:DUF922 domain-containing protein n=1 Tax=uncultured Algibacter sp. TaxID=298659 RepID=UPI0026164879|nr:DUF922 domain-containing protein [uncultured Algibacter sp.]
MIRFLIIVCCFFSLQQDEPTLSWNESNKLSWKDFLAKPNLHESAVAITASGITFEFSISQTEDKQVVSYTSNVQALFYPDKSWYKPNLADAHVLSHEQLHFDITELFARKFRKRISKLSISNHIGKDLKKIHLNILKELKAFQKAYDNETNFSINSESQVKWKISVEEELNNLSEFKSVN